MKHTKWRLASVYRRGTGDINQEPFVIREYPTDNPHMNVAEATLRKRYPEQGWSINDISVLQVYVANGDGHILTEAGAMPIETGDFVEIPTGEKYAWLPQNALTLVIASHPAWTPKQYRHIE